MCKNNSDLKNISFDLIQDEFNRENGDCFEEGVNQQGGYCCREKLNLTLRILHELIEEIISEDNIIHIEKYSDIKKDIYIERKKYYRIYGKTVDFNGVSYKDVLVRLFKYNFYCENIERVEVDKVFTDEFGEFNFIVEINDNSDLESYNVEIDNYYKSF